MFPRPLSQAPEALVAAMARWPDLVDVTIADTPADESSLLVDFCTRRFDFIVMCSAPAISEWLRVNAAPLVDGLITGDGPSAGWAAENYGLTVIDCTPAELELGRQLLSVRLELAALAR
jgi:hypothetical protein